MRRRVFSIVVAAAFVGAVVGTSAQQPADPGAAAPVGEPIERELGESEPLLERRKVGHEPLFDWRRDRPSKQASGRVEPDLELRTMQPWHAHHIDFQPPFPRFIRTHRHQHDRPIGQLELQLAQVGSHDRIPNLAAAELGQRVRDLAEELNREMLRHGILS